MKRLRAIAVLALAVVAAAFGCSSDPETPLGTEFVADSLITSSPGDVFEDTVIVASGDTSFIVNSVLAKGTTLTFGRKEGVETSMLLRFNFSNPGADTLRTVETAVLNLRVTSSAQADSINARFYQLLDQFNENDTLTTLNVDPTAIPDSSGTLLDRAMKFFPSSYTLDETLVQEWIRGIQPHNGVAVIVEDATTTKELLYGARENSDASLHAFLRVIFTDGNETSFDIVADGSFVQDQTTSNNLVLADGVTRRVYVPVDLSGVSQGALLHKAILRLHVASDSLSGDLAVRLYVPSSADVGSPGILTGRTAGIGTLIPDQKSLAFAVRPAIEDFINNPATNTGFVLRYSLEGISIRKAEFYAGSAADSLRPSIEFTFSEPPSFP